MANTAPEYSSLQKNQIVNHILEFYKDGKYMYDPDAQRQSDSHYTKKSEIKRGLDKWIRQNDFIRYIVPIIDFNLECDEEALEKEWDKNHRLQIQLEDERRKYKNLEDRWKAAVAEEVHKQQKEWISEKEDIAKLYCEMEEAENRHKERTRRHMTATQNSNRQIAQLEAALEKVQREIVDKRHDEIEAELNEKETLPKLKKEFNRISKINNKLEKDNLTLQKKKLDIELKHSTLQHKTDDERKELRTRLQQVKESSEDEIQHLKDQVKYYKIKEQVQVQVPVQAQEVQEVAEFEEDSE